MFYNNTSVCINPYTMVYIFLYVQCKTISSSYRFLYGDKELKPVTLVDEKSLLFNSCCLNTSHAVTLLGDCDQNHIISFIGNNHILPFLISDKLNVTQVDCIQSMLSFFRSRMCILKTSFLTPCQNFGEFINTCRSLNCQSSFRA